MEQFESNLIKTGEETKPQETKIQRYNNINPFAKDIKQSEINEDDKGYAAGKDKDTDPMQKNYVFQ